MNLTSIILLGLLGFTSSNLLTYTPTNSKKTLLVRALRAVLGTDEETVATIKDILTLCDRETCNNLEVMSVLTLISKYDVFEAVMVKIDDICDIQMKAYLMIHLVSLLSESKTVGYDVVDGQMVIFHDDRFGIGHLCLKLLCLQHFKPLSLMKTAQLPEQFGRILKTTLGREISQSFASFQYFLSTCCYEEVRAGLDLAEYGEEVTEIFAIPGFYPYQFANYLDGGLPGNYISPQYGSWVDQALMYGRNEFLRVTYYSGSRITKPDLIKTDDQIATIRKLIEESSFDTVAEKFQILYASFNLNSSPSFGTPKEVFGRELFTALCQQEIEENIKRLFAIMPSEEVLAKIKAQPEHHSH